MAAPKEELTLGRRTACVDIDGIKRATRRLADMDGLYQRGPERANDDPVLGLRLVTKKGDGEVSIALVRALAASARSAGLEVALDDAGALVIGLPATSWAVPQLEREPARQSRRMLTVVACPNGDIAVNAIVGGVILDIEHRIALPDPSAIDGLDALVHVVERCIALMLEIREASAHFHLVWLRRNIARLMKSE